MSGINQKLSSIESVVHEIRHLLKGLKGDRVSASPQIAHKPPVQDNPPVAQNKATPVEPPQAAQYRYQSTPRWKTRLETAAIIFGIGYAIVTGLLWWDQRQNFEADERAWVGIKSMKLTQFVAGKVLMGEVVVVDSGKTVAQDVTFPGGILTSRTGLSEALSAYSKLKQRDFSPNVLFPNIEEPLPSSTDDMLDQDQVVAISVGLLQVFLIGDIHYKDVFGGPHTTHYCGRYRIETQRFENCGITAN